MNNRGIFKNNYKLKIFLIALLMITVSGLVTYGAFFTTFRQSDQNTITSSCFSTNFTDGTSVSITGENAIPVPDEIGLNNSPYSFTIKNTCNLTSTYYVILSTKTGSFSGSFINLNYNEVAPFTLTNSQFNTKFEIETGYSNSYIIASGNLENGESATYDVRIWMNESATYTSGMSWEGQIKVVSVVAEHDTLLLAKSDYVPAFGTDTSNANTPKLVDNLIPVVYDEANDQWIKASTTQSGWYNYDKQIWANAVTTTDENRSLYNVADPGTIIPMSDILGMYVWIPRYEYQYTNLGTSYAGGTAELPGGIGINFISGTSTTETTNYIIHPAFRNGSVNYTNNAYTTTTPYQMGGWDSEITGFWYGKFETTGSATEPTIKPNLQSLVQQTVGEQFATSQLVSSYQGINLDSHMSKNSEWGAVSYLSQSAYGKYGNSAYSGANKEIYINNSSSYYTGRSMGLPAGATGNTSSTTGSFEYNDTHTTKIEYTKVEGSGTTLSPTVTNDTSTPWLLTDGVYKSNIAGVNSGTTNLSFSFTLTSLGELSFEWGASTESATYDYLYYTITKDGSTVSGTGTSTKIGGNSSITSDSDIPYTTITQVLEAGTYVVTFTYKKDSSVNKGTDSGYVKNFTVGTGYEYVDQEVPDVKNGVGASTTGNIYGVYDMVGGASEYVMGNYNKTVASSNLTFPNAKYYDIYTTTSATTACGDKICYGHGLSEISGWYSDTITMTTSSSPWFLRGAYYDICNSTNAGVWFSHNSNGSALSYYSYGFRAVLI